MAQLFDGKAIAARIQEELKPRIAAMNRPPGIAVVLVGNHAASEIYVRNKIRTCEELGIRHWKLTPPESVSTAQMLDLIARLNADPEVDAILVQMPLPGEVDDQRVLLAIDPAKDADGFHPENAGRLAANLPGPRPCTPAGVMEMLQREGVEVKGMNAVVVGRSDIVGKPMAMMLLHANATVTVCHSKTRNLESICRQADLLVAAMGRPAFLTRDFIRPGAVVVDVGINRLTLGAEAERLLDGAPEKLRQLHEKGSVIVGDVHPGHAMELASRFTPVPGGVGPLTIAMLMVNTVGLAERRRR
jgi:methylenetetrahydrofolate dehydrogenase (NADP+)/methenyltetrahydrofolate cyclohydrolase